MSDMIVHNQPETQIGASARAGAVYTPRFDIWETDNEFVLAGDLPGVTPENLDIQFENKELKIWGKVSPRNPEARLWNQEYGVGDYYRSFVLGDAVDAESIGAELKDGVLAIHLPKKAEARPRRIEVKTS